MIAAVILLALAAPAAPARDRAAAAFVQPRIDRQQYDALTRALGAGEDVRYITRALYEDYVAALAALTTQTEQAAEEAGRSAVEQALSGRRHMPPDRLREMRVAVLEAHAGAIEPAHELFESLIADTCQVVLYDAAPTEPMQAAIRQLRREALLHPRQADGVQYDYAGDGVDVLQLFAAATREGAELHGLRRADVADVLDRYERDLDALLRDASLPRRLNEVEMQRARIRRDAQRLEAAQQQQLALWRQLDDLNTAAIEAIRAVAERELGGAAAEAWFMRFNRERFPWLFEPRTPDTQYEWLADQSLQAATRAEIDALWSDYRTRREPLRSAMSDLMLRGRLELGVVLYPMMDAGRLSGGPPARAIYEQMVRLSGELEGLDAATSAAFEAALPERLRRQLRQAVHRR